MKLTKWLVAGLGFQLAILAGMITLRLIPLWTGESIALHVQPVDPRDVFRGDYVILSYAFSNVNDHTLHKTKDNMDSADLEGCTVYVSLEPDEDGRHWHPTTYSLERPEGKKFIKTTFKRWGTLVAGIEAYYVPEGTGKQYEDAVRQGKLTAHIRLSSGGKACLEFLEINR